MSTDKKDTGKAKLSLPKHAPDAKAPNSRTRATVRPPPPGSMALKPRAVKDAAAIKAATTAKETAAVEPAKPVRAARAQDERKSFGERGSKSNAKPSTRGMPPPARAEASPSSPRPKPRHERHAPRSGSDDSYVRPPRPEPVPSADGTLRLSKRMAELGLCSRREADEYIERGWVRVDGVVISELGSRVLPKQTVELAKQAMTAQDRRVTIMLNKPIGFVSGQAEDGYTPASVLITEENQWELDPTGRALEMSHFRGLAPAGRLDIDSTGLLVLTQDGRVAKSLVGDKSPIEKEYLVRVEGGLSDEGMRLLHHGLILDGVKLKPAKVSWANEDQLRFVLHEGRKRQIRRMCELVGLTVVGLRRVRIGRIPLGHLPVGQWRFLGEFEKF